MNNSSVGERNRITAHEFPNHVTIGSILRHCSSSEREGIPNDEIFLRGIERNRLHQTRFHHYFALRCGAAAVRCFRTNESFTHFLRLDDSSVGERNRITAHQFPNHVAIGSILGRECSSEREGIPNGDRFLRGIERNRLHQTRFHHHFALRCDAATVRCFRANEGCTHFLRLNNSNVREGNRITAHEFPNHVTIGGILRHCSSSEGERFPNEEVFLRGIKRNCLYQTRFHHHFALRCGAAAVRCFRTNESFTHFLRLNNSSVGEGNCITAHEFPNHVAVGSILRHCSCREREGIAIDEFFLRGIQRNRLHQTRFHHHFALRSDTTAVRCFRTNEGFTHLLSRELSRCSSWLQYILRRDFPLQRSISSVLGQYLSRDLQRFSHNNRRGRRSECDLLHLHFLWSLGNFWSFCRFTLNELLSAIYFSALLHPPRANGHVAFCRLRKRGNNWSIIHLCCDLRSWRKWSICSKFEVVVRGKPFKSNWRFHHLNTSIHQRIVADIVILEVVVDGF